MGDIIRKTAGGRHVRSATHGFGLKQRQRFLDALALTCNITKAAAFAGVSLSSIHRAKARDPAFAQQWQDAMVLGYDRLEALLLECGGAGVAVEPDPARAVSEGFVDEPFDFERALKILTFRRGARAGTGAKSPGRPMRNASRDETDAVLLKALSAAKRRVEARRARGE